MGAWLELVYPDGIVSGERGGSTLPICHRLGTSRSTLGLLHLPPAFFESWTYFEFRISIFEFPAAAAVGLTEASVWI